ncbi:MAG TPA: MFS transporter [Lapillicoccus sp.]|nr:MFS transporter [Lapillicoccus sp.]
MTAVLSPVAARRVFLTLTVTRWFPVGLVVGILTLWPLERGLTVPEALAATSLTGITVFLLELPTSGFADAFGRRPVYITAALFLLASAVVFYTATAWWQFALAAVLTGVFRALDSGPLEAWFVDTVHQTEPGADLDRDLSRQGVVLGSAMATGALLSGGLVWWHPIASQSALLLPGLLYICLGVVHLIAVIVVLKEPDGRGAPGTVGMRRAAASVREAPVVVREGLALLRRNRVLGGVVAVELFWAAGMVVFETFQPIRLSELLGSEGAAAAVMGPVASAGWGLFALGSALAAVGSRRLGVARTAILARVLNGLGAVVMGLVAGPVALIAAYAVTYTVHGAAGPVHSALLHREASARNRSTVLSMNSMVSFLGFSLTAALAGQLAAHTSTQVAMVAVGAFSVLGAVFYLPALRAERPRRASEAAEAVQVG